MQLQTERLSLRPMQDADASFLLELMNEPAWARYIREHEVRTEDDAVRHIQSHHMPVYEAGLGFLLVERSADRAPLGICGLVQREYLDTPDIGFAVLQRYWGDGIAFEASQAIIQYADDALKLSRLYAITLPDNPRSVRLLERLGFCFDRHFDEPESGDTLNLYSRRQP